MEKFKKFIISFLKYKWKMYIINVFNKLQEKYLLTPNLNLQILSKTNPQILQKSSLKSVKSNKKYEVNREKIINFIIHILFQKK